VIIRMLMSIAQVPGDGAPFPEPVDGPGVNWLFLIIALYWIGVIRAGIRAGEKLPDDVTPGEFWRALGRAFWPGTWFRRD
jgi:hypothetical protein